MSDVNLLSSAAKNKYSKTHKFLFNGEIFNPDLNFM